MQKSLLLNFISKYNNVGKIESVKWEIVGDQLRTNFISEDKSMIGEVRTFGFKSDHDGVQLGIYKTSQLAKLLAPLSNEISPFDIEKVGDKLLSIKLNDEKSKMNYALSDLAVIPHVPTMKHIPKTFELSFKLDSDFVDTYTKALAALPEVVTFSIQPGKEGHAILTLGQTDVNTNRFIMTLDTIKSESIDKLFFNASLLSEILSANKGVDAEFEISNEGLAKIKFETKEYSALYYLVAKKNQ
jgi:hypothetical protein